jgi:CRP/FNR family cyclic AMP-dependent transcriptional regulator
MATSESASLPLATVLPPPPCLARLPRARSRSVPAGGVLVAQGEAPARVFVVEEGAVALAASEASGRRAVLALLGPGDAFGEEALFGGSPAPRLHPEARALVPSRVLSIPPDDLRAAAEGHPQVASWLALALLRRAHRAEARLARTLSLSVLDRVLGALEDLARLHGRPTAQGVVIELPLTQEFLAAVVGATRESVNRAVRALVGRGALRRAGALRYVLPSDGPDGRREGPEPPGRLRPVVADRPPREPRSRGLR